MASNGVHLFLIFAARRIETSTARPPKVMHEAGGKKGLYRSVVGPLFAGAGVARSIYGGFPSRSIVDVEPEVSAVSMRQFSYQGSHAKS